MSDSSQRDRRLSAQVPADRLAAEFGKVYHRVEGAVRHVDLTLWQRELAGAAAEGWQTGVALDASASMKDAYGRNLRGGVPAEALDSYRERGFIQENVHDGRRVFSFTREGYDDAIRRGFVEFTPNVVEGLAREFIGYLAGQFDADGGTTVIYWACGRDGSAYEVLGDFTEDACRSLTLTGPKTETFGNGTRLTPAVRYFVDRFADAERGLYVFLTDGKLDDFEELKRYTTALAKDIAAGRRKPVKCVLIGLGDDVDEAQLGELDDLDTGTSVDVWDHKMAADLRAVSEIIVELVDETAVVAPTATVYDATGAAAATFADGLPARVTFALPAASPYFELEVAGRRIRQAFA